MGPPVSTKHLRPQEPEPDSQRQGEPEQGHQAPCERAFLDQCLRRLTQPMLQNAVGRNTEGNKAEIARGIELQARNGQRVEGREKGARHKASQEKPQMSTDLLRGSLSQSKDQRTGAVGNGSHGQPDE